MSEDYLVEIPRVVEGVVQPYAKAAAWCSLAEVRELMRNLRARLPKRRQRERWYAYHAVVVTRGEGWTRSEYTYLDNIMQERSVRPRVSKAMSYAREQYAGLNDEVFISWGEV